MSCGMTASCQMAEQVYQEWKECETIFGRRPRRGMPMPRQGLPPNMISQCCHTWYTCSAIWQLSAVHEGSPQGHDRQWLVMSCGMTANNWPDIGMPNDPAWPSANDDFAMLPLWVDLLNCEPSAMHLGVRPKRRTFGKLVMKTLREAANDWPADLRTVA